jgi:hypothetical protein
VSGRIVRDMPAPLYHSSPAIGSTALRTLVLETPAHFEAQQACPVDETKDMRIGTYVHTSWLESERWRREFVAAPAWQHHGNSKEGKAERAAFRAAAEGRIVVDADEHALVESMAAALRKHPAASRLLSDADAIEPSIFFDDETTGVECRDRPDLVTKSRICVELKTCQDASQGGFGRTIANSAYHVQLAHHDAALRAVDIEPAALVWVAVEKTPPHCVAVRMIDPATLAQAHTMRTRALDLLVECREAKRFKGYDDVIVVQQMPAWASQ